MYANDGYHMVIEDRAWLVVKVMRTWNLMQCVRCRIVISISISCNNVPLEPMGVKFRIIIFLKHLSIFDVIYCFYRVIEKDGKLEALFSYTPHLLCDNYLECYVTNLGTIK